MLSLCLTALLVYPIGDLELKDGDRVVLVGGALIEREQQYGHLEVLLHAMFPDRKFTVRNLGWSGDTVWGEARAGFGSPADGCKALVEQVKAARPTVLILGYGTSEAFAGKAGVPRFVEQYKKLLKDCVPEGCRLMFLTVPHPKHPQVSPRFAQVEYDAAIKTIAQEHHGILVDAYQLYHPWDSRPMTDDGMLPNALGYQKLAQYIGFAMTREERARADKQDQEIKPVPAGDPVDTLQHTGHQFVPRFLAAPQPLHEHQLDKA